MSSYEENRQANIARLQALVEEIGLDIAAEVTVQVAAKAKVMVTKPQKKKKKKSPTAKRPREEDVDNEEDSNKAAKVTNEDDTGRRRSSRTAGKPRIDYSKDTFERPSEKAKAKRKPRATSSTASDEEEEYDESEDEIRSANKLGTRTQDPKQFGSIPGIPVGKRWETRMACSTDAIHAPVVAGISGNKDKGAWSVALSGGYEDDVDLGYAFTFTGAGGRDLKGTKNNPKNLRTAPQSCDQSFDNPLNAAIKKSSENKKPVRVIRGFKLKSKYAPQSGYRYDGLYKVEKAWMERGLSGFMVCKYAFVRVPGQPPIPETTGEEEDELDSEIEEASSGAEAED